MYTVTEFEYSPKIINNFYKDSYSKAVHHALLTCEYAKIRIEKTQAEFYSLQSTLPNTLKFLSSN